MTDQTAQPETAAEQEAAPRSFEDAFEDFAKAALGEEEEDTEGEEPEGDEPEAEEAEGDDSPDEGEEPEAPAIDPPVSWGTDAKELFAQLPPELQQQVVEREAQREKFVQGKALEAAEAKRTARIEFEQTIAQAQRQYAQELEQTTRMFLPAPPDPALAVQDPATYVQQKALYDARIAQFQDLKQQADAARQEAEYREQYAQQQALEAEMAFLANAIPEWNDPAKRAELSTAIANLGTELGYTPDVLAQVSAQDVLALKRTLEWRAKAEKYDNLQKSKMEAVRAAKKLPKVAKPGVSPTNGDMNNSKKQAAWQRVKTARNERDKADAFADYLGL